MNRAIQALLECPATKIRAEKLTKMPKRKRQAKQEAEIIAFLSNIRQVKAKQPGFSFASLIPAKGFPK